ncbi:VOC family protein [Nonomuraea soli]
MQVDNTVTWFEVATDDPEGAERFYGGLFGWRFGARFEGEQLDYRRIGYSGSDDDVGGLFNTNGDLPSHAVFHVQVADVTRSCEQAESLGGKVVFSSVGEGPTDFAYIRDTSGSLFGIFHGKAV